VHSRRRSDVGLNDCRQAKAQALQETVIISCRSVALIGTCAPTAPSRKVPDLRMDGELAKKRSAKPIRLHRRLHDGARTVTALRDRFSGTGSGCPPDGRERNGRDAAHADRSVMGRRTVSREVRVPSAPARRTGRSAILRCGSEWQALFLLDATSNRVYRFGWSRLSISAAYTPPSRVRVRWNRAISITCGVDEYSSFHNQMGRARGPLRPIV